MPSAHNGILRLALKTSKLLRTDIAPENLAAKRVAFVKLKKYFPIAKTVVIKPENIGGIKAEWITTPESRANNIMLYLHGGGFVLNSTEVHRELISRIAAAGRVTALSLDYSLAPENPFPVAVNETLAAYKWLLDRHIDPANIVLAGDSAGGSLVLSALHLIRQEKLPNPACAVVIAPATDATFVPSAEYVASKRHDYLKPGNMDFFVESYFQKTPHDHPVASPLFGSFKGFPPLLVHASKDEYLHVASERLVEKARLEGVKVKFYEPEGLPHVWHLFARYLPEAREAIQDIGDFIKQNLK